MIIHASQTLAGVLNLAGPPLLGLLASRLATGAHSSHPPKVSIIIKTLSSRLDTGTVMLVLGASLVLGAAPLALASIGRACACSADTFAPVPPSESC